MKVPEILDQDEVTHITSVSSSEPTSYEETTCSRSRSMERERDPSRLPQLFGFLVISTQFHNSRQPSSLKMASTTGKQSP